MKHMMIKVLSLVMALTMINNFVSEYLFQRFVVFRKSIDTAKK